MDAPASEHFRKPRRHRQGIAAAMSTLRKQGSNSAAPGTMLQVRQSAWALAMSVRSCRPETRPRCASVVERAMG
eukprot:2782292-Pyramimonas_sp.AAC.1